MCDTWRSCVRSALSHWASRSINRGEVLSFICQCIDLLIAQIMDCSRSCGKLNVPRFCENEATIGALFRGYFNLASDSGDRAQALVRAMKPWRLQ